MKLYTLNSPVTAIATWPLFIFTSFLLGMTNVLIAQSDIGLQVAPNHNVLFGDSLSGPGTKLMWIPEKHAFRAGSVDGGQWDMDSIGDYSVAYGQENLVKADHAYITGKGNSIGLASSHAHAKGLNNVIGPNARYSEVSGSDNSIGNLGYYAKASGTTNKISHFADFAEATGFCNFIGNDADYAYVHGQNNKAYTTHEYIFGQYADTTVVALGAGGTWNDMHQLFALGNGMSDADRNNAMTVLKGGNVGINTAHPDQLLTISKGNEPILRFDRSDANNYDFEMYMNSADLKFRGGKNNTATPTTLLNDLVTFHANGNVTVTGTVMENSDARLKKNIIPLSSSLPSLMAISGYTYDWKDESRSKAKQIGLLAQEVQTYYPELVHTDDKGTLSVNYSGMVPILVEGMKEQQSIIDNQKSAIEQLQSDNIQLESRLRKIEELLSVREEK